MPAPPDTAAPSHRWRSFAAPFLLLLLVVAFFWKLLLTNQYSWLQSSDLAYQVVPWFQYEAVQFHQHVFPLWDPFQFAGQSLIGQDQPGLAYPLNWILFALPFRGGHISYVYLTWYYMAIHYFAALFCYWLCRDLGRGQLASVLGGLSFGLGGYIGNTDWPQILNGAVWGPLVFLFLFRALRGVRPQTNAALSGLFLGISWLGGHHLVPLFLSLAATGVWLYSLYEARGGVRTLIRPAGLFVTFTVLASAFQLWPALAYARTALRWVGSRNDPIAWNQTVPYTVQQQFSLSPRYLLGILVPGFDDGTTPYVGIVALTLVILAVARNWKTNEVRLLFGVGLAGLLFAMAKNDVFHGILYSLVPMVEKAREPASVLYLFHFAIAVLIAFGMDSLLQLANRDMAKRLSSILLGFAAVIFIIMLGVFLANGQTWRGDDRVMITVFAAFALSGLLFRMSRAVVAGYGIPALIVALYILEIGNSAFFYLPHKEEASRNVILSKLDDTKQVADFLRSQPGPIRVWTSGEDVPFNFGDWYGIDVLFGYAPSAPADFYRIEYHTLRGRQIFSTAYGIGRKPPFPDQKEIFRDSNGLAVFQNPDVMPRIRTVHSAVQVRDLNDARRHLQDPGFNIAKSTFSYAPAPAMPQCDGDTIEKSTRGINQTSTTVTMKCRGMVVMSENNAPGWIAMVDGRETPVYDAYTTLRGVVVDAGRHTIEMRYRPMSVTAGAAATLLALLSAIALWRAPFERTK